LKDVFSLYDIKISEKIRQGKDKDWYKYVNPILHYSDIHIGNQSKEYLLIVKNNFDSSLLKEMKERKEEVKKRNKDVKNSNQDVITQDKESLVMLFYYYNSFVKVLEFLERNSLVSLSCKIENVELDMRNHSLILGGRFYAVNDYDYMEILLLNMQREMTGLDALSTHVLNTLLLSGSGSSIISLSANNIEEICTAFIAKLECLNLFSKEYLKEYKRVCVFSLHPFINKPKQFIISELCKKEVLYLGDHFSANIMFLICLYYLFDLTNGSVDESNNILMHMISKFKHVLLDNIMQNKKLEVLTFC